MTSKLIWTLSIATLLGSPSASAQTLAVADFPSGRNDCDLIDLTNRLRWAHPLGAVRESRQPCLAQATAWVPTTPMESTQRLVWRQAIRELAESRDAVCRLAAKTLVWLEQVGTISVWTRPDTALGMVYYGATYLRHESAPLAIQLWDRAFERPPEWLAGAMAHEAFHVLQTDALESEAIASGDRCAALIKEQASVRPTLR